MSDADIFATPTPPAASFGVAAGADTFSSVPGLAARRPTLAARRRSSRSTPYEIKPYSASGVVEGGDEATNLSTYSPESELSKNWPHSRSSSISSAASSQLSSWSEYEDPGTQAYTLHNFGQPTHLMAYNPNFAGQQSHLQQQNVVEPHSVFGGVQFPSIGPINNVEFPAMPASLQQQSMPNMYEPAIYVPDDSQYTVPHEPSHDVSLASFANHIKTAAGHSNMTEKAKTSFVANWLLQSFQLYPEGNVSRQALYGAYVQTCASFDIPPINPASFGKAVRATFPNIKTRRLGVRGASKYHYCGMRPATQAMVELVATVNAMADNGDLSAIGAPLHQQAMSAYNNGGLASSFSAPQLHPQSLQLHDTSSTMQGQETQYQEEAGSGSDSDGSTQNDSGSVQVTNGVGTMPHHLPTVAEDPGRLKRQYSAPSMATIPGFSLPDLPTPTALRFLQTTTSRVSLDDSATPGSAESLESFSRRSHRRATLPDLSISIPPQVKHDSSLVQVQTATLKQHDSAVSADSSMTSELSGAPSSDSPAGDISVATSATTEASETNYEVQMLPEALRVALPTFEQIVAAAHPVSIRDLDKATAECIWQAYKGEHCQGLLTIVAKGSFEQFETALLSFWANLDQNQQQVAQHPALSGALYQADAIVYKAILSHLNSQLLDVHDHQRLASLSRLAGSLENAVVTAFSPFPKEYASHRIELAARTSHLLMRHLGLVELAKSVSSQLAQPGRLENLQSAWSTLDLEMIKNQAALVTNCQHAAISAYLDEFLKALTMPPSSEPLRPFVQFAQAALRHHKSLSPSVPTMPYDPREDAREVQSRWFVLKWSYISHQIVRHFVLNGSPALQTFQSLGLFIEEWIAFTLVKEISLHVNAVAASVQADDFSTRQLSASHPSTFLVSPAPAASLDFMRQQQTRQQLQAGQVSAGRVEQPFVQPGASPMVSNLAVPSSMYSFSSALTPTTRAIFGDLNTPHGLHFPHLSPSAPYTQFASGASPNPATGVRSSQMARFPSTAAGASSYSTGFEGDFSLPLPSPAMPRNQNYHPSTPAPGKPELSVSQ